MKIFGITSPYTGSGKTTVTLAFANLLENSAVFKIGPDFIDTGLARSITHYAENIDRYLESRSYKNLLCDASLKFKYGIFEGVMGLYDSGADILSAFKCEGSGYRLFWLSQPFHPYTRRVPTRELYALIYYIQNSLIKISAIHPRFKKRGFLAVFL